MSLDQLHRDKGLPLVLVDIVIVQMFGWLSAAARASRLKRSSA